PIDKTFGFTEPDTLELGRASGFIENATLSRKQALFEVRDGKVYVTALGSNAMMKGNKTIRKNNKIEIFDGDILTLMQKKYPFTVTITQTEQKVPDLDSLLDDNNKTRLMKNLGIGASTSSTPKLPPQHNYELDNDTPSQLLNDMLSSQSSLLDYGTNEEGKVSSIDNNTLDYTRTRELSNSETSDDGAEGVYDSDEISSIGSVGNIITDESSYLGSSFNSSDSEDMIQEIDDVVKEDKKGSRVKGKGREQERDNKKVIQDTKVKEVEKRTNVRGRVLLNVTGIQSQKEAAGGPKNKAKQPVKEPKNAKAPAKAAKGKTPKDGKFIPYSTTPNTGPGSLDFYYLLWNVSYTAGEGLPINIIVNPKTKAPSEVSLTLFDEYNNIKLTDIASKVAIKAPQEGVPFAVYTWTVANKLPAEFDFKSGHFTLQMSYLENGKTMTKDRRIKLNNVIANPGGAPNPATVKKVKNEKDANMDNKKDGSYGSTNSSDSQTSKKENNNNKSSTSSASKISISIISVATLMILQFINVSL
ncbi:17704_t:CDS:2, partial [Funneliformis geosporum]